MVGNMPLMKHGVSTTTTLHRCRHDKMRLNSRQVFPESIRRSCTIIRHVFLMRLAALRPPSNTSTGNWPD